MVEKEQVLEALACARLPVKGVEITMAAPISASVQNAELEIKSFLPLSRRAVSLRVICKHHGDCIPFYATAVWPDTVPIALDKVILRGSHTRGTFVGGRTPLAEAVKTDDAPAGLGGALVPPTSSIKSGSPATLMIEDGRIHIRLRVVCLQNGNPGDKVRVTTSDHKQTYVAEVLAPNLLRGSL